jgi:hypothetical protein
LLREEKAKKERAAEEERMRKDQLQREHDAALELEVQSHATLLYTPPGSCIA